MSVMGKRIIGIDIGGTHFRIGAVMGNGQVWNFQKLPTAQVIRSDDVLSDLAAFIDGYCSGMEAEAVSIGFPATLDRNRQTVLQAPNLGFMENLPVVSFLSEQLGIPVFAERDVTFALCFDMVKYHIPSEGIACGFYFGTGIGNAICINGQPLLGKNGTAGELGHIPVDGNKIPLRMRKCGLSGKSGRRQVPGPAATRKISAYRNR